jgi:hypothetical protein
MDLNEEVPQSLEALVKPHVDSFDWFVDKGIQVRHPSHRQIGAVCGGMLRRRLSHEAQSRLGALARARMTWWP